MNEQEQKDGSLAEVRSIDGFIHIKFQCGPIKEVGVNGTQIPEVLDVLCLRLIGFQAGKFRCRENALAITKIEEAIMWLGWRKARRIRQGTEGTNQEVAEGDVLKGDQNAPPVKP